MKLRVMGQIVVGLACALFFLWLALHRVPSGAVVSTLRRADPGLAHGGDPQLCGNLGVRARRWQIILRPVAAVPYPVVAKLSWSVTD